MRIAGRLRAGIAVGFVAALLAAALPFAAAADTVITRQVTFTVTNTNGSLLHCATDGRVHRIAGEIIGPQTALASSGGPAALYLHGLGFDAFFWHFTAVPGYDFAGALAARGHVSVIIDRLGYGASDHPAGTGSCIGGQADIAHQIIGQLRSGAYAVASGAPVRFGRIALIGHSAGGATAEVEAYSFHDVDALGVLSWADQAQSPLALSTFGVAGLSCALGGQPSGGAPGYAPFGTTAATFDQAMFHDADPAVVAATNQARNPDPCSDDTSIAGTLITDPLFAPMIHVPVLLVFGANDALFPPPAGALQRLHFTGSNDVTFTQIPDTGHAVTLERSAPALVDDVGSWLAARGF